MSLSVGIQLAGVDDYIATNQVCVMPVRETPQQKKGAAKIVIGEPGDVKDEALPQLTRVTVRLEDCLACSGCITSAETVLIQQQGLPEFRKQVAGSGKRVICTVADESVASMAAAHNQSFAEVWRRIVNAMKKEGVEEVRDLQLGMYVQLEALYQEYLKYKSEGKVLLSSTCPGWVCYVEKMQGDWIFPYMSKVASAMSIQGMLTKETDDSVYHVSIQMCYDKKLEATKTLNGKHPVDCVLATSEIDSIIDWDEAITLDGTERDHGMVTSPALFIAHKEGAGEFKATRNKDFHESGSFAIANGFRNIQNVVRMLKSKTHFSFVEVEACPGGCICGGGQIKCSVKEKDERVKRMMAVLKPVLSIPDEFVQTYQRIHDTISVDFVDHKKKEEASALHLNW